MVTKKIKNKKAQITLTGIVGVMVLLGILFLGSYAFLTGVLGTDAISDEAQYSQAYEELNGSIASLESTTDGIETGFRGVFEPEEGTFAVWNGLRGLGELFQLPLELLDLATDSVSAVLLPLAIPTWALTLTGILIMVIILFTIIGAAKGEQRM